jgi:hypothetical protein
MQGGVFGEDVGRYGDGRKEAEQAAFVSAASREKRQRSTVGTPSLGDPTLERFGTL